MAQEQFMVLNMPFDEAEGAKKTYDYSPNRADGVVTDASFEAGRQSNCIRFDGTGKCEVQKNVLDMTRDFTICTWVKLHPVSNQLIIVFNYNGINKLYQKSIELNAEQWYYLAISRSGNTICTYLNSTLVERAVMPNDFGNPIGISINQDNYNTTLGNGCLDETRIYQKELTQEEIDGELNNTKQLAYLLDGVNFKEYGVFVSASKGLLGSLKMKDPLKVDFSGYHGEAVDLARPRFEAREITLECFIHSTGGKMEFVKAVTNFLSQFNKKHITSTDIVQAEPVAAGLHRLTIDIHPTKALVYEVYLPDATQVEKVWNDRDMTGTFTLTLREPEPVKKVLKHIRVNESSKQVSITITTSKLVNIYWGDGTTTQDVYGANKTITHNYTTNGDYYVVVTGVIEDIEEFTTNAIIVWDKL